MRYARRHGSRALRASAGSASASARNPTKGVCASDHATRAMPPHLPVLPSSRPGPSRYSRRVSLPRGLVRRERDQCRVLAESVLWHASVSQQSELRVREGRRTSVGRQGSVGFYVQPQTEALEAKNPACARRRATTGSEVSVRDGCFFLPRSSNRLPTRVETGSAHHHEPERCCVLHGTPPSSGARKTCGTPFRDKEDLNLK